MSNLLLDETALQAALDRGDELYEERELYRGREDVETMARREVGALISAYLAAAGFERVVEEAYRQECVKTPWVPVVQAEGTGD